MRIEFCDRGEKSFSVASGGCSVGDKGLPIPCSICKHYKAVEVPDLMQNPIVQRVHAKINQQQEKGLKKYGEYVNPDSYTLSGWLTHLQQELIDGTIYIECALKKLEEKANEADS